MNDKSNIPNTDNSDDIASESLAVYGSQPQVMEHLRHQGVETLMKIDDITSLQSLIPQIQKIYLYSTIDNKVAQNKERLLQSINLIKSYEDNWDDEGAPAILPEIIDFTSNVINCTNDYLLEYWSVFPSNNGTLKMEIHQPHVNAGINIGREFFSYYIHSGEDEIYGKSSNTRTHVVNILSMVYYGE